MAIAFFFAQPLFTQIEGDNIFANDQIIMIELEFYQNSFWDSLVLNYETESYMKADLTLTDSTGTSSFEDVGVRLKGNSSYSHPGNKKSLKIDFNKYVKGQNYDGLKKLNFSNGFKDPSLMREKLFFDQCRAVNVPAPRANFANVYINGTLWGFYTVIEQIDDQFLDWRILDDDGNLFKAADNFGFGPGGGGGDEADLGYYGMDQSAYEDRYQLKSNEEENDWTDLIDFISFINNSTATEFENNLSKHIELDEYLRSAALDNLFSNLDSYTESARNYYLYHNLTTDKWEWIKWDGNESFGSYGGGPGMSSMTSLALDFHGDDRPLLENIFNSSILYQKYQREICYLIEQYFNPDYMNPIIDSFKELIKSSVYADNNKMFSNNQFNTNIESDVTSGGGPMGGRYYGLKSFIQQKHSFVNGQLNCSEILDVESIDASNISIYPNPVQSTLHVDLQNEAVNSLKCYNAYGLEIFHEYTDGKSLIEIDISALESGMFFLVFFDKEGKYKSASAHTIVKLSN